jgi:transcriptional regulator with PAS, ATPase and Fis domain
MAVFVRISITGYKVKNYNFPPLKQRQEDIAELAEAIILKVCRKDRVASHSVTLSENVIKQMKQYAWPGNIRELANLLEKAARRTSPESPCIASLDLPDISHISGKTDSYQQLKDVGMSNK